ncbi:MAG: hypothetical protein HMLKMBBP_01352 [Planctomycetes bacterium]|nr:hypothetical protein [Planctomycetota bacterium]
MHGMLPNGPAATRSKGRARGFTLLEVMLATSILAVGTVSVLMVFASALGFANRRQAGAQLTDVLDEARSEARVLVNTWRPASSTSSSKSSAKGRPAPAGTALPYSNDGVVPEKQSTLYDGFRYALRFEAVQRGVPEAGVRTIITVKWGDGLEKQETFTVLPSTIPLEEFSRSITFDEESAGKADVKGGRENR